MHTIDSKNRMSLPAAFRQELQEHGERPPILTAAHQCLQLHPYELWEAVEDELVEDMVFDPERQSLARMMISDAVECPIDKNGRILVPPYLRESAGLDREVTVAGVGPMIELWDKARFEEEKQNTRARFPEMSRMVGRRHGT